MSTVNLLLSALFFLLDIYTYAIIAYIFMSWLPGLRESAIGQFIGRIVEPYLEIFRKIIPPLGMFDFSPIVAIFALNMFKVGLAQLLNQFILPMIH